MRVRTATALAMGAAFICALGIGPVEARYRHHKAPVSRVSINTSVSISTQGTPHIVGIHADNPFVVLRALGIFRHHRVRPAFATACSPMGGFTPHVCDESLMDSDDVE